LTRQNAELLPESLNNLTLSLTGKGKGRKSITAGRTVASIARTISTKRTAEKTSRLVVHHDEINLRRDQREDVRYLDRKFAFMEITIFAFILVKMMLVLLATFC